MLARRARLLWFALLISVGLGAMFTAWGVQLVLIPGPYAVVGDALLGIVLIVLAPVWMLVHAGLAVWVGWARRVLERTGTARRLVAAAIVCTLLAGGLLLALSRVGFSSPAAVALHLVCAGVAATGLLVACGLR